MKRFEKSRVKDCFSQDRFIYEFEKKIDKKFIGFLKRFGQVKIFKDFPIPLIKMDEPDRLRMTALMNTGSMNVFFKKKRPKDLVEKFEKGLEKVLK